MFYIFHYLSNFLKRNMLFFIILASLVISCVFAEPITAIAYINNPPVTGLAHFSQDNYDSPTKIHINITGLAPGSHGIHIHQFGDLSQGKTTHAR